MERLGHLLAGSPLGHENTETIKAAAIIAAANRTLKQELQLAPDDALATSFRRGELIIRVSHGAIGGQININQARLLESINQTVGKIYPGRGAMVERLVTRQN